MTVIDQTTKNVVALHALSEAEALDWLRAQPGGRVTATDAELGRRWNWHRQRVGRRLKAWVKAGHIKRRGDTVTAVSIESGTSLGTATGTKRKTKTETNDPPRPVTPAGQPDASVPAPRPDPRAVVERIGWSMLLAGLAFLLGIAATAVGLYINASFLWKFGRSSEASLLLAVIGFVTDGMTVTLPSVAVGLWLRRQHALAIATVPIYLLAITMTALTALGFASQNISDAVHVRGATKELRADSAADLASLRAERSAIKFIPTTAATVAAAQRAHDQECTKLGPICRQRADALNAAIANKTLTDHAADLDRRISAAADKLAGIPVLAAGDPQVEAAIAVVTWASMGTFKPTASDVEMLRVLGVAAIPIVGGLLLSFAFGLAQPARTVSRSGAC